jgi:DNA-binding PadR family transcriptional regulator
VFGWPIVTRSVTPPLGIEPAKSTLWEQDRRPGRRIDDEHSAAGSELPNLPATSWAVLGMLAFNAGVSGYDIKKWADWTVRHFYWSPSHSQIYSELKRLETMGYATSRVDHDNGLRGRRLYRITEAGQAAVTRWSREARVDPPVLKHSVLLRVWLGHLNDPNRLKEIVREHIAQVDTARRQVAIDARGAALEPAWAYARIAMRWAQRSYDAERELALQLIEDIDEAAEALAQGRREAGGDFPMPTPERWRAVEEWVASQF